MELLLMKNELINMGSGFNGGQISCIDGSCWITQEGDSRDHFLKAGQSFTSGKGRLLVTALESARLQFQAKRSTKAYWLTDILRGNTGRGLLFVNH
jgi:hypothetical protein